MYVHKCHYLQIIYTQPNCHYINKYSIEIAGKVGTLGKPSVGGFLYQKKGRKELYFFQNLYFVAHFVLQSVQSDN